MIFNEELHNLIINIAKENNIKVVGLSHNYILQLTNLENKNIFIYGNLFPLNNGSIQKICCDKSALSDVLSLNNIPHIHHTLFKNPKSFKEYKDNTLLNYLTKNPQGVVLKDNNGSCGKDVYLIKTKHQLKKYARVIFKNFLDIAVCPYVNYTDEYRLIMLDGECLVCYKKIRPFVVGDGKTRVYKLIKQKFKDFAKEFKLPLKDRLKVLESGATLTVGWKHNLKHHSEPQVVKDNKLKQRLISFAKNTVRTLGLRFSSVDLIINNGKIEVLEINSIVTMLAFSKFSKQNYDLTKKIYLKAIQKSFEEKGDKNA